MSGTDTARTYEQGWQDAWRRAHEVQPNLDTAMRQSQLLHDVTEGLGWLLEREAAGLFTCDCDPLYEADTNAWNHEDDCATFMEAHLQITLDQLRELTKGLVRIG